MKNTEWVKLKNGDKAFHRRYGSCTIVDASMPSFGLVVNIDNQKGQDLLHSDCGAEINTLMVGSKRELISKEEKWQTV